VEILAVVGIIAAFALVCAVIYPVRRLLQRKGRDLNFVDPHYPDSMQAVPGNPDMTPPGRPYPVKDTSLSRDDDATNPQPAGSLPEPPPPPPAAVPLFSHSNVR
jgi:hypothetical protein